MFNSPDLKLATNSTSLAENSRSTSRPRSGHFSQGTFRPAGNGTAAPLPTLAQLPVPLILCVPRGQGATFALHAWDNDDPPDDDYALAFDSYDDDDDTSFTEDEQY